MTTIEVVQNVLPDVFRAAIIFVPPLIGITRKIAKKKFSAQLPLDIQADQNTSPNIFNYKPFEWPAELLGIIFNLARQRRTTVQQAHQEKIEEDRGDS